MSTLKLSQSKQMKQIENWEPKSVQNTISIQWSKAKDCLIYSGNKKWIDFTSGIFVTNAGHSNPKLKKALIRQINSDLLFAYNYPTDIKFKFLKKLIGMSKHFNSASLLSTGSEATDLAYKLIKIWAKKNKRKYIITFKGNYHGRGLSCDLISGSKEKASWSNLSDDDVIFLDFPFEQGDRFDSSKLPPPNEIAAFFLETFQGWGAWFYPEQYIQKLYSFARNSGALVCFDEMQAGFYRLGSLYGYMTYGKNLIPDMICVGKGISSSLPISAVLSRKEIFDIDTKADLHGTHSANSLCCAAAFENLNILSSKTFQKNLNKSIQEFERSINSLSKHPNVKQVNARGLIGAVIFNETETATNIVHRCIEKGILPVCTNKNSIKFAPPLSMKPTRIKKSFKIISQCIKEEASS